MPKHKRTRFVKYLAIAVLAGASFSFADTTDTAICLALLVMIAVLDIAEHARK